ncbi:ABC transporter ATP-binding protein [Pseudonocardia ailaonensis]|uniref:ABC transporter ATP-binding protein n=1 Tax=Pseudonocardia ailaonensis TaxID=367279 RepID=A0ABN2MTQ8_9PSEU
MSEVRIDALTKTFDAGGVRAVDGLSLTVGEGELVVLLGPSGCGKTTLLRCVAGLERPDSGTIEIAGETMVGGRRDVPTHRRGIGMVFQNYALWPHMTIEQNVAYPLRAKGVGRAERSTRARRALALVECEPLAGRLPSAISGGQQQRVALARALVAEPRLLLFDEPLSNLDYRLRAQLRQQIRELHLELGFTGVYVTHDQTEAMQLGTKVAVLRDGRVEQLADPQTLFSRPASAYVARFLGIANELTLERGTDGRWRVGGAPTSLVLPHTELSDAGYDLRLRSSDIELAAPGTGPQDADRTSVPGTVTDAVYGGDLTEWIVRVGDARLSATARTRTWPFGRDDRVDVVLRRSALLVYERTEAGALVPLDSVVGSAA